MGLVGISRDITARKQAEESLQQSEQRYHSLFDTVPVGIYQSTLEGKYLTVNRPTRAGDGCRRVSATISDTSHGTQQLPPETYCRNSQGQWVPS